jgi:RecA-family ATPase
VILPTKWDDTVHPSQREWCERMGRPYVSRLPTWFETRPKGTSDLFNLWAPVAVGYYMMRESGAASDGPLSFTAVLKRKVPPVQEIIPGLVEKGIMTLLSGPGGVHKSRTAVHWGLSVAAQAAVYGRPVERCHFVYLSYEDGDDQVAVRAQGIARRTGLPDDIPNADYWDLREGNQGLFAISEQEGIRPLPFLDRLKRHLQGIDGHKFIVADSAYNVLQFIGNAKINEALVKASIEALSQLCRDTDSTMILLWHPSQAGQARGDSSGWSVAWHNAPRARLSLNEKKDGDRTIEGLYELRVEKRNNAAKGEPLLLRWDDGVLSPPNLLDEAAAKHTQREACIRVAIMAARAGAPITMQRNAQKWQIDEVARETGRPISQSMFKEELHQALIAKRLRYVPGKSKTRAGYFPFIADTDGNLPEAEYKKLLGEE